MARDPDALKISKWAASGGVEDPEDGDIDRDIGWDASYSQPGGSLPKREHINEILREVTALGVEQNVPRRWAGVGTLPSPTNTPHR